MIEINGRQYCENCFSETTGKVCKKCGFNSSDSAPDPSMLIPGGVLQNRYVIGQIIGRGGFGITYLAYDALVQKKIAIKEYFPYGIALRTAGNTEVSVTSEEHSESFKLGAEKFYNEAKLVSKFSGNPNIVAVYDCFCENCTVYIAMEYLSGLTLKEFIRENGILKLPQALFIAKNIAGALVVAHSASVLHRDISPENIMICDNGDVKLIDFGAARQVVAEHSQSFSVIIKPSFSPPEQYRKKGNQGPWTDVYSLGTTLYFTLTGDIPGDPSARFDDDDTFKENQFNIDAVLWGIITKATKLEPEERYADAYELKKALDLVPIKPEPLVTPNNNADAYVQFSENSADLGVSIKNIKPKQSFFRKHLRTFIEATCGLLAIAIILPLAVKVYGLTSAGNTSVPNVSGTSEPEGSVESFDFRNVVDLDEEGFNKPLYSCLSGNDKALYSYIYDGLRSSKENIDIPTFIYTASMVSDIFDDVLSDNPTLNYVRGYSVEYIDDNGNKEPDADEKITSITPDYTGKAPDEVNNYIEKILSETDLDEKKPIEFLCVIHDKLINETDFVARNSTPSSSTAYGALIEHSADDLGFARAMCDFAQRLGYFSFVVDTRVADVMNMALVRIKIDEEWYSINIIGDASMNVDNVFKMPLAEDGKISHMWFLNSDFYLDATGLFKYVRNFDEKYSPVFPIPEKMTVSGGELIVPTVNYYIEKYLNVRYYYEVNIDSLYSVVLEESKAELDSGNDTLSLYMLPGDADSLWERMQESFVRDFNNRYDITISGFEIKFSGDQVILTLKR